MTKVFILGGGLAGLSAAYHLKDRCTILEKEDRLGGILRCEKVNGFEFDRAPHLLYSKDDYASKIIKSVLLKNNFYEKRRKSWVFSKNVFTKYPFQANQFGLPPEVIKECVLGLIEAKYELKLKPTNFKEWCLATFGKGISKHFMIPYNEKLWAIPLEKMDFNWIAERVPMPKVEDVLEGALRLQKKDFGPNTFFWYPKNGGIEKLVEGFEPFVKNVQLNSEVTQIDTEKKEIEINGDKKESYEKIISSLPLPVIVKLIKNTPQKILDAAKRLEFNKVHIVMIGINRESKVIGDKHWVYIPEKDFIFYRLTFMRNFLRSMVPEGCDSVIAEVSESKHKKLGSEDLVEETVRGLKKMGIMKESDKVIASKVVVINPAYIIYTHNHKETVGEIHRFLRENDILCCGRFGNWEYYNMDHAILSGKRVVEEINS